MNRLVIVAALLVLSSSALAAYHARPLRHLCDKPQVTAQASAGTPSQTAPQAAPWPPRVNAKMQEGYDAFRKGEYFYGLTIFQEVLDVAPDVVVAHNMAGNCSLQLKDYPAAVASFKRALELQPDEPHNLSGLTQAYRLAGMIKQRDAEREHIRNSQREGRLPTNFQ